MTTGWNKTLVLAERLRRQGFTEPLADYQDEVAYISLFRKLQPVAPVHFTRPGDPPKLVHRTEYDDMEMSSSLRVCQSLVKGRFQGGRVAYVLEDDLKLYATAFCKRPKVFKQIHEDVMIAVKESGGLTKEQLKEDLPYPPGEVGKALQDLQTAFLLYEQQTDNDWDTGWLIFAEEWFEISDDPENYEAAVMKVLLQFIESMVFASEVNIKSWSGWTAKTIRHVVSKLVERGELISVDIEELGKGLMGSRDIQLAEKQKLDSRIPRSIWMLDKSDYLVRAELDDLQARYKGLEVLQYLLVDGVFRGVVLGHWRIGPYDIDDILMELDETETAERKEEVLHAVRKIYEPSYHAILRYNGQEC
ncbi:hypothetical protein FHR92_002792 [Fontibacillus solani]|uniref:Winged helix DNA-binding domain-containing protein n=1 Tax=Fontibacillus solani TaxID=1572857 RepID=A0A7W3SUB5_9BACL|nr:crosslink repair DNA glycosylase YcaQ family protein [Fontibacillus solani]MBA9086319.1 hypothetical protein [Fontibacillus solani]